MVSQQPHGNCDGIFSTSLTFWIVSSPKYKFGENPIFGLSQVHTNKSVRNQNASQELIGHTSTNDKFNLRIQKVLLGRLDLDLFGFSEAWTAAKNDAAALGAGKPHYCGVIGFHNARQTVRHFQKTQNPFAR